LIDQQNLESKSADEGDGLKEVAPLPESIAESKGSWLIRFSAFIGVVNLVAIILFGVWYAQNITNTNDQIEVNKLALNRHANQLQIELSESVPNLGGTVKTQGLELERLIAVVAQIENSEQALERKSRINQSMVFWYLRDLLAQINGVPLDPAAHRIGLAYLQQLRDALTTLDLEPQAEEIVVALNQDLISLEGTKTLNRSLMEAELVRLIELSSQLELPVDSSSADASSTVNNSNLNADWSFMTDLWQEIKSLIQVRQVEELSTSLDAKYFYREALRLKLLEVIYLIKAGDIARITVCLDEIQVYVKTNFDLQGAKTQAALALIANVKGMTDITVHDFSSTLISIEDYFLNINLDKTAD
jgi:uncharacterized protein HemX